MQGHWGKETAYLYSFLTTCGSGVGEGGYACFICLDSAGVRPG